MEMRVMKKMLLLKRGLKGEEIMTISSIYTKDR